MMLEFVMSASRTASYFSRQATGRRAREIDFL